METRMTTEAICECPKCGRLHKHLQAGMPPASRLQPLPYAGMPSIANPYRALTDKELAINYAETAIDCERLKLENNMLRVERDRSRISHTVTSIVLMLTALCLAWSVLRPG